MGQDHLDQSQHSDKRRLIQEPTNLSHTPVLTSVAGLASTLLIAWRALPPWQGRGRDKTVVLGFGVAQLLVVIIVATALK